jgi:hypothetical protein
VCMSAAVCGWSVCELRLSPPPSCRLVSALRTSVGWGLKSDVTGGGLKFDEKVRERGSTILFSGHYLLEYFQITE